jgi:predicted dehydrogenase
MDKIRVALIGCGGRGRGHLKALAALEGVEVVALCDPVPQILQEVGVTAAIDRLYADPVELLEKEKPQAAVVATPAHINAATARLCLERGIHTLMEKPPGLSAAETRDLREIAQKTGARAMVGWNRRFHPLVLEAKRQILKRGPVAQLVGEFHKSMAGFETAGAFPRLVMENMIFETPIHAIDLVRHLAGGEVAQVHAASGRGFSAYPDMHAALVVFDNGCVGQITANYTTDARLERYEIHGRQISAYIEGVSRAEIVCDGGREILDTPDDSSSAQARFFFDCLAQDRPIGAPAADLDEAVKTMELTEAILTGTPVGGFNR